MMRQLYRSMLYQPRTEKVAEVARAQDTTLDNDTPCLNL